MATKQELEAAILKADAAGDKQAVEMLVREYKRMEGGAKSEQQPVDDPNIPASVRMQHDPEYWRGVVRQGLQGQTLGFSEELGAMAGAGAATLMDGAPFRETYTDMRDNLRAEQNQFAQENPGTSLAANVAGGFGTGVGSGLFNTMKGSALMGGLAGYGFTEEKHPARVAKDVALGAAAGAGGQYVLSKAAEKVMRFVGQRLARGGVDLLDETGKVSDEAISAMEAEVAAGRVTPDEAGQFVDDMKGVLTPDQMQRLQLFQRRGVTPLRANVTQATDDFGDLQSTIKQSNQLAETVASQDAQMIGAIDEGISAMRPRAQNMVETNANVFRAVDDVIGLHERAVNAAYRSAREQAGGESVVGYGRLMTALRQNTGKERVSGGVISAVKQELKNRGIAQGWKANGRTNIETAEEVRQAINALYDPANPRANMLIKQLKDALDDDVASVVSDDVFDSARQANIQLKKLTGRAKRDSRDRTNRGFMEDILSNRIPEEKIVPRLLTGRDDDFVQFKNFLLKDAGDAGVQAWDDVRAQVLRDALNKAMGTMGKGENGQAVFNSNTFKKALTNLQSSKKYTELYNADERALIKDIIDIGWLRIPQRSVQAGTGPSGAAIEKMMKEVSKRLDHQSGFFERVFQEMLSKGTVSRQLNPGRQTADYLKQVRR